jgi:hypothetical protein
MIYRQSILRNRREPLTAPDVEHELEDFVPLDDSYPPREKRKRKHEDEEMSLFRRVRLKTSAIFPETDFGFTVAAKVPSFIKFAVKELSTTYNLTWDQIRDHLIDKGFRKVVVESNKQSIQNIYLNAQATHGQKRFDPKLPLSPPQEPAFEFSGSPSLQKVLLWEQSRKSVP